MTTTAGQIGYGSKLKRGDGGSPESFTAIAEVRKITSVGEKRALVDFTNLDSPNTAMEYKLAMKDGLEFSAECTFLPDNATQSAAAGMIFDSQNGTVRNFQITLPAALSTKVISFAAVVLGWNIPELNPQSPLLVNFQGKITGPVTIA